MRYLWSSIMENGKNKIPVFIELRDINDYSDFDLESYIFYQILKLDSTVSNKKFVESLSSGEFILILDGFDEINTSIKSKAQKTILEFSHRYEKSSIIVSRLRTH